MKKLVPQGETQDPNILKTESELRKYYDQPLTRSIKKQKAELDKPSREFIQESPFICLATTDPNGSTDCSPKGDPAGFVKILSDKTIAIPDRKGNNRLDSLVNITKDPKVGIVFFIPGRNETLRVNGKAKISVDEKLRSEFSPEGMFKGRLPTSVILVDIEEVYFHCPKALIRSELWKRGANLKDLRTYIKASSEQLGQNLSTDEIAMRAKEYKESLKERLY